MITLKLWNSLAQESRDDICRLFNFGSNTDVRKPYHHNFDYDTTGKLVKVVLSACNLQKNGSISVTLNVVPKMATKTEQTRKTSKPTVSRCSSIKKKPIVESKPLRWKFRRYTTSDPYDGEWCWAYGRSEQEAREYLEHEYWDTTRLECYGHE